MIYKLIELAENIEAEWELESFPEKAQASLSGLELPLSLEAFEAEMADWLSGMDTLPEQLNLYNVFGEPPITLFNNKKFAIDVYFWRKNDTVIHSHAFRGAFKVLYGKSLHEEFQVEFGQEFEAGLAATQLTTLKKTLMDAGDTQVILPGHNLVHRLLHIDNPTVSLCVRTVNDFALSQWHHMTTGISWKKENLSQLAIKKILYFQYLYLSDSKSALNFLNTNLDKIPMTDQLSLFEGLCQNEFAMEEQVMTAAIDLMWARFQKSDWFVHYEQHYQKMNTDLLEFQASQSSLKVLAHAINCNYSIEDTEELLRPLTNKTVSDLCEELLSEQDVFQEEVFAQQTQKIMRFASQD